MSAAARTVTVDGKAMHEATGHGYPEPAGRLHEPEWGPWGREHGMWMRQCRHPACDLDDWSKEKPTDD